MIEILPPSAGQVVGVRASGKLSDQDYQEVLIPTLEAAIKKYGEIRFLCFMDEEFAGLEPAAMWDDARFFFKHKDDFEKMALVGGPKWVELSLKLFAPLMEGETRTFRSAQLPDAWEWLQS